MSHEDYVREVKRHLQNATNSKKLDEDSMGHFLREVKSFLHDMVNRKTIDEDTMRALLPDKARTLRFYILPKTHKPENPGRPIVSSWGSPTEGFRFVDYHLNPLVRKISSYMKDITDFLLKLQDFDNLPSNTLLLTLTCNWCDITIHKYPSQWGYWIRSLPSLTELLRDPRPTHWRPNSPIKTHPREKLFYIWRWTFSTNPWDGYGHTNGPVVCQHSHGQVVEQNPPNSTQSTYSMVEVHWRHLCHMAKRWGMPRTIYSYHYRHAFHH